jgi:hypothetical protein
METPAAGLHACLVRATAADVAASSAGESSKKIVGARAVSEAAGIGSAQARQLLCPSAWHNVDMGISTVGSADAFQPVRMHRPAEYTLLWRTLWISGTWDE